MPDKERFYTFKELCDAISITYASGRNWLKTGKITSQKADGKKLLFSHQYLLGLKRNISSSSGKILKSRRNKKFVCGNKFCLNYILPSSPNYGVISQTVENGRSVSDTEIRAILSDCAVQLLTGVFGADKLPAFEELINDISHKRRNSGKYSFVPDEDTLGVLYVSLLNLRRRKASGIYYTPQQTIREVNGNLFSNGISGRVIDPCCGTGNFLLQLPDSTPPGLVYGSDIDSLAVAMARVNFALKFKADNVAFIKEHITIQNLLHLSANHQYDFVIGNPPWGYDFPSEEKEYLRKHFTSIESACCMTEMALKLLAPEGKLSFVLPESLLHTGKYRAFREHLLHNCSIDSVQYIGEVFDGVQCPGVILELSKRKQGKTVAVSCSNELFTADPVAALSPDGFKLNVKPEEHKIINKLLNNPNCTTLEGKADFALGIVTGNNQKYLSDTRINPLYEPVVRGTDLKKYQIVAVKKFIHYRPELFQQTAPEHIYRTAPKLLYRFISRELVFACDKQGVLSLNSCNTVIPHIEELDIRYIMAVFNSRTAQFFFDKCFNSVKVLRRHLEAIPIPLAEKSIQEKIVSDVEKLSVISGDAVTLYEETDKKIAALYGLDGSEYQIIVAATDKKQR